MGSMLPSQVLDDDDHERSFWHALPLEEDWGVVLLRVGIASLEATGLRGWNNEVAPINMPLSYKQRTSRRKVINDNRNEFERHGVVRLGRANVADVQYATTLTSASGAQVQIGDASPFRRRRGLSSAASHNTGLPPRKRGFFNEVRTVDLGNSEDGEHGLIANAPRRRGYWRRWAGEMLSFIVTFWGVLKGLVVFAVECVKSRLRKGSGNSPLVRKGAQEDTLVEKPGIASGSSLRDAFLDEEGARRRKERELYERFLRGEEISDDEDDEEAMLSSGLGEDDESNGEEEEDDSGLTDREAEAVSLFKDFLRNTGSDRFNNTGEMVLAHLVHSANQTEGMEGSSPLTRRRWNDMLNRKDSRRGSSGSWSDQGEDVFWDDGGHDVALERRDREDGAEEGHAQSTCVICTIEARDIICWPCRYVCPMLGFSLHSFVFSV